MAGVNKTNKSSGPRKFLERVCKDVFKAELTHACQGHVIDATAEVHRDPGSENLAEGGVGFVQAHSRRFRNEYVVRDADGKVQTDLIVWYYDHSEKVEPIKTWTQSGRTKKVVASEIVIDVDSRDPLPAGTGFQAMLRAGENRDRAARGIRDHVIEDPRAATSQHPISIIFCGVGNEISPPVAAEGVVEGSVRDGNPVTVSSIQPQRMSEARERIFLQGRGPMVQDPEVLKDLYPGIGEGEMSSVHFIVHYRRYCKGSSGDLRNWLVTSVDTDQWMVILLAMGTGKILSEGQDAVNVTVARYVRSTVEYIHVNRIFQAIAGLTAIGEHAGWPSELPLWLDNGAKAILFVLVFVLSGCDFLPAIVKCPFLLMWDSLLRGLAIEGFFGEIVSADLDGHVKVNENEALKIIALTYVYRDRHAFPLTWDPASVLNHELHGSIEKFVNVIRRQVFNLHGDKGNMLCPTLYSLRAQGTRAGATLDYWQGALKEKMPRLEFKGRGWDTESGTGELTKSNVVVVVSEHCHINANGKVKKLICGCNPDLAAERGCKGNCSCWRRRQKLCSPEACGCKGRCGRVKADAEASDPTAAQAHHGPVGVDGTLSSICGRALGDTYYPVGGEKEFDSDGLSGTSDSDADGQLIDEDGDSDTSSDYSPGGERATLEELYDDGL